MGYRYFATRIENRVGWLIQNHPPFNAFGWDMLQEMEAGFADMIENPEVRVVVFASALEKFFCVGGDLKVFDGIGTEGMERWVSICHRMVRLLRASPKPFLAAINGTAVGGGLEVTWHFDFRFAAVDARLGQPEIAISFLPPVGTTQALTQLIGRSRALRFLYDGALHSAAEAKELGLIDEVVPAEDLVARVQAYGEQLAAKPAGALAALRRCVIEGGVRAMEDGLAIGLAGSANFAEGIRAFLEKRDPVWE